MTLYPTKEEILDPKNIPSNQNNDLEIIKAWKKKFYKEWKKKNNITKFIFIKFLIEKLAEHHKKKCQILPSKNHNNYYVQKEKNIYLDLQNPSILTALHEFGHHIHGESELKACTYSIWNFKEVFPEIYKKMKWHKHMLKL